MSSSTLAARTIDRATAALREGACASLPEIVKLLSALSADSMEVQVNEMAELIQQDPTILAKVMSVANTLYYNPTCTTVGSVSQAIHVIGYTRIRTLAMSLMLAEHASRTRNPEEQREAAAQALTAGCIAQATATGRMMLDPEQAFVCASLRNFGRIVMTSHMAEDYRIAKNRAAASTDDEAFREVFGLTPLELGRELLKASNLPESLLNAIQEIPADKLAVLDKSPEFQTMAIAHFSEKLASLTLNANLTAAEFIEKSRELAKVYQNVLPALEENVTELIQATEHTLNKYVSQFGLRILPGNCLQRLRQRVKNIDPPQSLLRLEAERAAAQAKVEAEDAANLAVARTAALAAGVAVAASTGARTVAAAAPAPGDIRPGVPPAKDQPATPGNFRFAKSAWTDGAERIAGIVRDPNATRDQVLEASLEMVQKALASADCVVFSNALGSPEYRPTHGSGKLFEMLRGQAKARSDERTVVGVCLARRENVLIHNANDPKIVPYLPAWMRGNPAFGAAALLPIVNQKHVHGIIIATWGEGRNIVITPEQANLLRSLLAAVGGVCERRRY